MFQGCILFQFKPSNKAERFESLCLKAILLFELKLLFEKFFQKKEVVVPSIYLLALKMLLKLRNTLLLYHASVILKQPNEQKLGHECKAVVQFAIKLIIKITALHYEKDFHEEILLSFFLIFSTWLGY